jgi:uncharacterized membrane protein YdjX (TVP38/TMEM64 family)
MKPRAVAVVLAVVVVVIVLSVGPAREWAIVLVEWIRDRGAGGAVLYAALYVVAALAFVPGAVLTGGAGFVYGAVWGSLLVIPASVTASLLAFAIARRFARDRVARRVLRDPRYAALDRAIARAGFKLVLLVRLSPIFPYTLLNYALAVTAVRFRDYAIATIIGMLPGTVLYVYLGSVATTATDLGGHARAPWLYWGGLVVTLLVVVTTTWVARGALKRELQGADG